MKEFKIKAANKSDAEDIQRALFKLGYSWQDGNGETQAIRFHEALTFYVYSGGLIMHSNDDFIYFGRHTHPEETLESLQELLDDGFSKDTTQPINDAVNNPKHYTSHPSGIECIDVTRHMSFNLGNATKYIWRCDLKKDAIEDLRKAIFYLNDEINLRLSKKQC